MLNHTMEDLTNAACVMVGGSSQCSRGSDLATFVENGGVLIVHSYCCTSNYSMNNLGGRFSNEGFHPISFATQFQDQSGSQNVQSVENNFKEIFPDLLKNVNLSNCTSNQ